jgi:hypothetical protein
VCSVLFLVVRLHSTAALPVSSGSGPTGSDLAQRRRCSVAYCGFTSNTTNGYRLHVGLKVCGRVLLTVRTVLCAQRKMCADGMNVYKECSEYARVFYACRCMLNQTTNFKTGSFAMDVSIGVTGAIGQVGLRPDKLSVQNTNYRHSSDGPAVRVQAEGSRCCSGAQLKADAVCASNSAM